jgi:hypothetical protein
MDRGGILKGREWTVQCTKKKEFKGKDVLKGGRMERGKDGKGEGWKGGRMKRGKDGKGEGWNGGGWKGEDGR